MADYTYIKEKIPDDWVSYVSDRLKDQIKQFLFSTTLSRASVEKAMKRIDKEIEDFSKEIDDEELRKATIEELTAFARENLKKVTELIGTFTPKEFAAILFNSVITGAMKARIVEKSRFIVDMPADTSAKIAEALRNSPDFKIQNNAYTRASSLDMYYGDVQKLIKEHMKEYIEAVGDRQYVNLRAYTEMNLRYQKTQKERQKLVDDGVELVFIPPHVNCSKRCQPFQGRVYSLNGTYGKIDDRDYVPIEDVSDKKTYTSKKGKTYPAGLFSYNCRHTMKPYTKGQLIEKIPDDEIEKARAVEEKQREFERSYRRERSKYAYCEDIAKLSGDKQAFREAAKIREDAALLRKQYEAFSKAHGVPFYPDRLKELKDENLYQRTKNSDYRYLKPKKEKKEMT